MEDLNSGEARTAEPTALELEEMCSKEPQGETKAKVKNLINENDKTENMKSDPPAVKTKSLIPVFKKDKKMTTNRNPTSKPSSSKEPSIFQCGECPAGLKTKPELLRHMKSHISK